MNPRFLLTVVLGVFGAHKFYLGNKIVALIYLFTLGLFLVGWVADSLSMGFRGRDAFFSATESDPLDPAILDVSPITKLVGFLPLVFVLVSAGSDNTQTSENTASSAPELAEDVAFCAGYYESLVPGLAEQRHCAGSDLDSQLLCGRWAFEGVIGSKPFQIYRDQIATGYRLGQTFSMRSNDDETLEASAKCVRILDMVVDQIKK